MPEQNKLLISISRNPILIDFLEKYCEPIYFMGNSTQFSCAIVEWLQKAIFISLQCYYLMTLGQETMHKPSQGLIDFLASANSCILASQF